MCKEKYDLVYDVFLRRDILSLRKYKNNGFLILEFSLDDLNKVRNLKLIPQFPCIYILENSLDNNIYIGQSNNFSQRVVDHKNNFEKIFDNIYIISNENFNKDILLKIEEKTIEIFKSSIFNFNVTNIIKKSQLLLNERDILQFKDFWKNQKEIYKLLRFNLLEQQSIKTKDYNDDFYYKDSIMSIVDGGYILRKDSKICMGDWSHKGGDFGLGAAIKIREKMIEENNVSEDGILLNDFFWKYPSAISGLVSGLSNSGYDVYKNKNGVTLDSFLNRKI